MHHIRQYKNSFDFASFCFPFQNSKHGHSSIEDARAAMELYKFAQSQGGDA